MLAGIGGNKDAGTFFHRQKALGPVERALALKADDEIEGLFIKINGFGRSESVNGEIGGF